MNKKYNSIDKTSSDIVKNQNMILELLTKIDQAINTNDSFVSVNTLDQFGNEVTTQIVSVSHLNSKLEQLSQYVRKLTGFDGYPSTITFDSNGKKLYSIDVNEEPSKIHNLDIVSTFKATPNWIFDSMMNPKISVELDLTDKISEHTKKIISKRFIVEFETLVITEENGWKHEELTYDGRQRLSEFNTLYKGKNNIQLDDFLMWLERNGVRNRVNEYLIDDDKFEIEPLNIQYKGYFTIFGTELDQTNNKLWYIFDTLTYKDLSGGYGNEKDITLTPGTELAINNPNGTSATIYKVAEISTITSQFRVRLEKVFGDEPVPVMQAALRIHSHAINHKKVNISVGYDEYSVLFIKPLNSLSHIQAVEWSDGLGFYTNELRLNDVAGEVLNDFYTNKVYDYGLILEELTEKKIPTFYGIKPDAPVLIEENFTIVQTNKHLTNTTDAERIRDLHNSKINLSSEILQIQNRIEKDNATISKKTFSTEAQKKSAQESIAKLKSDLINKVTMKNTITAEILQNKKNINKIKPTYALRGIFPFPKAKTGDNTKPQEVVQFEVWYRKLSKSGDENTLQTFKDISKQVIANGINKNLTALDKDKINNTKNVNATFSNWVKFKTDARKQVYNSDNGQYEWEIEDISDANTPTINQIDIPVEVGETIEIKIKSLSEVGFPEAPLESEFSNTITVKFPENLESIINEDDFILTDATADNIKSEMLKELETLGVNLHISSQVRDVDVYYAHTSTAIASGFKDNNGKIINLYDYLLSLKNELQAIKEEVNRAKGILEIYLLYKNTKQRIYNTNNITINIQLEDYMTKTKIGFNSAPITNIDRTYVNDVIAIKEYSIQIKNAAESALLGLLAHRGYGAPAGYTSSEFAYKGGASGISQPCYVDYTDNILVDNVTNTTGVPTAIPRFATQVNNSFVWQHFESINGEKLTYDSTVADSPVNIYIATHKPMFLQKTNFTFSSKAIDAVISKNQNIGMHGDITGSVIPPAPFGKTNVSDSLNFTYGIPYGLETDTLNANTKYKTLGTTIHAAIQNINALKNISQEKIQYIQPNDDNALVIPIYIYAKPFLGSKNLNGTNTNDTEIDTTARFTGVTVNASGPTNTFITLTGDNTTILPYLKVGSKVILSYVGPAVDGKICMVTNNTNSGGTYTVTLNVYKAATYSAGRLDQVHILNTNGSSSGTNNGNGTTPMKCFNVYTNSVVTDTSVVDSYIEIINGSVPVEHIKTLRFTLEDELQVRPVEFQLNFKIIQHKLIAFTTGGGGGGVLGGGIVTG